MELQGKIKVIEETQSFGEKNFLKRGVVVTTDEQYPQEIMVEFVQDKTAILDYYKVGDDVKIGINIRGRIWRNPEGVDKYFTSIQGWFISKAEAGSAVQPPSVEEFEPSGNFEESEDQLSF